MTVTANVVENIGVAEIYDTSHDLTFATAITSIRISVTPRKIIVSSSNDGTAQNFNKCDFFHIN